MYINIYIYVFTYESYHIHELHIATPIEQGKEISPITSATVDKKGSDNKIQENISDHPIKSIPTMSKTPLVPIVKSSETSQVGIDKAVEPIIVKPVIVKPSEVKPIIVKPTEVKPTVVKALPTPRKESIDVIIKEGAEGGGVGKDGGEAVKVLPTGR
jgi:hypothetical protein